VPDEHISERVLYHELVAALAEALYRPNQHMAGHISSNVLGDIVTGLLRLNNIARWCRASVEMGIMASDIFFGYGVTSDEFLDMEPLYG